MDTACARASAEGRGRGGPGENPAGTWVALGLPKNLGISHVAINNGASWSNGKTMPKYKNLKRAFEKYCEESWEVRENIYRISTLLYSSLKERGGLPDEHFFPCRPGDSTERRGWTPEGATVYNQKKGHWEFGMVLELGYKKVAYPKELLWITVLLRQRQDEIEIALDGKPLKASFPVGDPEATQTAVDSFADDILEAIENHYTEIIEKWVDGQHERVIGFRDVED